MYSFIGRKSISKVEDGLQVRLRICQNSENQRKLTLAVEVFFSAQ
jgi:hypothetical protein